MNATAPQLAEVIDLSAHRLRKVENYVSKNQLARHFGFTARTVDRWCLEGCPHTRFPAHTGPKRFRISEVEDWLSSR